MNRDGFTLAELLVGVVVLSLITGATTAAVSRLARARSSAIAQQQAQSRAHRAAAMIADDVSRLVRDHDLFNTRVLVTDERDAGRDADGLLVVVRRLTPVRGLFGIAEGADYEVQYRIDESGLPAGAERDVLWRRADPALDDYQDAGGVATPVLEGVIGLSIEVSPGDDEDWETGWDSDLYGYPQGIRVTVTATDDRGRREAVARRTVSIDRVPLPPLGAETETTTTTTTGNAGGTGADAGSEGSTGGGGAMRRRGFATILVIWVLAVSAVLLATLQAVSLRHSSEGREALARVRAYWAARGGVEATIARLANDAEDPDPGDPYRVVVDMEEVAQGVLDGADYLVSHTYNGLEVLGPSDAHAKMNVSTMGSAALLLLPYMGEDMADAIVDWIDGDDDVSTYGAESSQYQQQVYPYRARNGPARTLAELELVLGVEPEYVRGDDRNLNGAWDAGEGSGRVFETEWSELITTASVGGGLSITGQTRLDLPFADPNEVAQRLTITSQQAEAIVSVAAGPDATIAGFITSPLPTLAQQAGVQNASLIPDLTDEQLALLIGESTIGALLGDGTPEPGKVNINTAADEVIELLPIEIGVVDALIAARNSRGSLGFASIVEIIEESPLISRQQLAQLYEMIDVRSNVYVARCVGRDTNTGIEVEIIATLDRSTLPVVLREVRVR